MYILHILWLIFNLAFIHTSTLLSVTHTFTQMYSKSIYSWSLFNDTYDKISNGPCLNKHLPVMEPNFPHQNLNRMAVSSQLYSLTYSLSSTLTLTLCLVLSFSHCLRCTLSTFQCIIKKYPLFTCPSDPCILLALYASVLHTEGANFQYTFVECRCIVVGVFFHFLSLETSLSSN